MSGDVSSSMYFLCKDPLYEKEKVFELKYDPPPGHRKTNMQVASDKVFIEDIRGKERDFTFARNGFAILNLHTGLCAPDFDRAETVTEVYAPQVAHAVKTLLGATRVQVFDYVIRKCYEQFPISTGGLYKYKQPSTIVHVDTTPPHTEELLEEMNPEEAPTLKVGHYQYVNIWKPLRGKVCDWPLALCDPRSVEAARDLQARDLVDQDRVMETYQVHWHKEHRWYYVSEQTPDELWVFVQSDSDTNG